MSESHDHEDMEPTIEGAGLLLAFMNTASQTSSSSATTRSSGAQKQQPDAAWSLQEIKQRTEAAEKQRKCEEVEEKKLALKAELARLKKAKLLREQKKEAARVKREEKEEKKRTNVEEWKRQRVALAEEVKRISEEAETYRRVKAEKQAEKQETARLKKEAKAEKKLLWDEKRRVQAEERRLDYEEWLQKQAEAENGQTSRMAEAEKVNNRDHEEELLRAYEEDTEGVAPDTREQSAANGAPNDDGAFSLYCDNRNRRNAVARAVASKQKRRAEATPEQLAHWREQDAARSKKRRGESTPERARWRKQGQQAVAVRRQKKTSS
jgi:hypothetical protein